MELVDEVGLAEGFEIGVLVGEFFEAVVEFDGTADVGVGGGEITPLGGVAAEVELDERVLGVEGGCLGEDFGSGLEGVAAAFGEGPGDEPAGLVGVGGSQFGSQQRGVGPFLGALEEAELELHDASVGGHGGGKMFEFLQGVGDHTEVGIADGALGAFKILL